MPTYARDTQVPSDRSRAEIEQTLRRWGADQFLYAWDERQAVIEFRMRGKRVRFVLPLPDPTSDDFLRTPTRRWERSNAEAEKAYEQAVRQRWRALALVVKAKLEAVESNIVTFEAEFLAHIVLPDNRTVGQWAVPQVEGSYLTGQLPPLLPGLPPARENTE